MPDLRRLSAHSERLSFRPYLLVRNDLSHLESASHAEPYMTGFYKTTPLERKNSNTANPLDLHQLDQSMDPPKPEEPRLRQPDI